MVHDHCRADALAGPEGEPRPQEQEEEPDLEARGVPEQQGQQRADLCTTRHQGADKLYAP